MKQYAAIDDTVYFWFGSNDTSGSGDDGASPAADVRLAGAAVDAIPVYSPTPVLLTHANYPAGAYEVAIAATAVNGFAANNTYAVFCTLTVDSQNPTGFVGSFDLKPVESNVIQIADATVATGTAQLGVNVVTQANIDFGATQKASITAAVPTATAIIDEFETQSQADPTGFHVNVLEIGGTAQTANDNGADINAILIDTDALTTRLPAALTEPTQGAPSATPAPMDALAYLYMFLRNKRTTTATLDKIYADDGTTPVTKTTIADDGTTLTKSEYISGA